MKKLAYTIAILFIASSAQAADQSKAEASAVFRVKVATCKAQAKDADVKTNSSEFYAFMSPCLDKVTVAVNVTK